VLGDVFPDYFYFNLIVRSLDGSPLRPPVVFHLHESYRRPVIQIRAIRDDNTARLEDVTAVGVSTFGVQVLDPAGNWTSLELNLARFGTIPDRFR
jgi:hypothetical protein